MKLTILFAAICVLLFSSCNTGQKVPNTDIDVASAFIRDILENDFAEAEKLVLQEETNKQFLEVFKKDYNSKNKSELENYRNADIIINEISPVNDSVSIINYSNSYKRDKSSKLKLVRVNGQWLVDLKYTFSGNM
jgi:hypothetical protein